MTVTALRAAGDGGCSTPVTTRAQLSCKQDEGSYVPLLAWTLSFLCVTVGAAVNRARVLVAAGESLCPPGSGQGPHATQGGNILASPSPPSAGAGGWRRQLSFGLGMEQGAGASSKAQEGNQCTSVISMVGPSFHPAALGVMLLQRQQSDHHTLGTHFPARQTAMRMYGEHLNVDRCSPASSRKARNGSVAGLEGSVSSCEVAKP